jgi:hypothetical protein
VFNNIKWTEVKEVIEEMGLGEVEKVDMVPKKNAKGESFKRVFIHFKSWTRTPIMDSTREWLLSKDGDGKNNMLKIVYDDPWYWKIGMSNACRPDRSHKRTGHKGKSKVTMTRLIPATTAPQKAVLSELDILREENARLRAQINMEESDVDGREWGGGYDWQLEHNGGGGDGLTPGDTPYYAPTSPASSPSIHRQVTDGTGHLKKEVEEEMGSGAAAS